MKHYNSNNLVDNIKISQIFRSLDKIRSQTVACELTADISDVVLWCEQNFGRMRVQHPMYSSDEYIDYSDGYWAYDILGKNINYDDNYYFWFAKDSDKTLFKLTWI